MPQTETRPGDEQSTTCGAPSHSSLVADLASRGCGVSGGDVRLTASPKKGRPRIAPLFFKGPARRVLHILYGEAVRSVTRPAMSGLHSVRCGPEENLTSYLDANQAPFRPHLFTNLFLDIA